MTFQPFPHNSKQLEFEVFKGKDCGICIDYISQNHIYYKTGMIIHIVEQMNRRTDDDVWGKGVQEGWTCFKEGNLQGEGADCPHVLKNELAGKKKAWINREL
ncbi:hypothetical protein BTVI_01322 [Pitangus sulphuratus]|nr:hypothetical protein BTVI_83995 [Pitangus sulphuratus]KAJ7404774.1 hypothetical protein BTVI_71295 [Pitangus sulphuratus]KAJ7428080.1 hypothetical protein BTVI_01322 [Pitangus sulphuratus]